MKEHGGILKAESRRWRLLGSFLLVTALLAAGCRDKNDVENVPPPIPSGVTSLTGDGWVEVYWNPILGLDDLEGYGVYRSSTFEGPYHKLGVVFGAEANFYRDETVVNGVTYFYAVDAFDREGLESALSLEEVFDTPRPARAALRIYHADWAPGLSGVDLSEQPSHTQMLVAWNDAGADFYVYEDSDGVPRVVGTTVNGFPNDLQDVGWTSSLDDIGWAPPDGWTLLSPLGFELVLGHTYVVWTWDDHFAKFRVTAVEGNAVVVDWAYQIDPGNQELVRPVLLQAKGGFSDEGA